MFFYWIAIYRQKRPCWNLWQSGQCDGAVDKYSAFRTIPSMQWLPAPSWFLLPCKACVCQSSLPEWRQLLDFIGTLPRNQTQFEKRTIACNGNIIAQMARLQNMHQPTQKALVKQKMWSSQELDEQLKAFTPKTRHNASAPTLGTRRKTSSFCGDVVPAQNNFISLFPLTKYLTVGSFSGRRSITRRFCNSLWQGEK